MKKPAIFAITIVIALMFMNVINFAKTREIYDEGWLVTEEGINKALKGEGEDTIDLTYLDYTDSLFTRNGAFFAGEKKERVLTEYPMYTNGGAAVRFFDDRSMLITPSIGALPTYDGIYLSGGMSFNQDRSRADGEEFILASLANGNFILAQSATVTTQYETVMLKMNSVVNFTKESLYYLQFDEGKMGKSAIHAMTESTITIGENTYQYYELLRLLGKLQEEIAQKPKAEIGSVEEPKEIPKKSIIENNHIETLYQALEQIQAPQKPQPVPEGTSVPVQEPEQQLPVIPDKSDRKNNQGGRHSGSGDDGYDSDDGRYDGDDDGYDSDDDSDDDGYDSGDDGGSGDGDADGGEGDKPSDKPEPGEPGEPGNPGEPGEPGTDFEIPVITLSEKLTPWVYNVKGGMDIYDPNSRLYLGARVYIYNGDQLFMRKTIKTSGEFTIEVLEPGKDYTMRVAFQYYNADGVREEVEVTKKNIPFKTLGRDLLSATQILLDENKEDEADVFSNKIQIKDISFSDAARLPGEPKLLSEPASPSTPGIPGYTELDTIKYIERVAVNIKEKGTGASAEDNLSSSALKKLKAGETVTWESTTNKLKTNKNYTYTIDAVDRFGVSLPLKGGSVTAGAARTSKAVPTATVKVNNTAVQNTAIMVEVVNPDNASLAKPVIRVMDENGAPIIFSGTIDGSNMSGTEWPIGEKSKIYKLSISNLPAGRLHTIQVYCDSYDINDKKAYKNKIIVSAPLYTDSMVTLGYVTYNTSFENITEDSALIVSRISGRTNELLRKLMTKIEVTVKEEGKDTGITVDIKKDELENNTTLPVYVSEKGYWKKTIESGPDYELYLTAAIDTILEEPWQAVLASASGAADAPSLCMEVKKLNSATNYETVIKTWASQGSDVYDVSSKAEAPKFRTLKKAPEVIIKNSFTLSNAHEIYDFKVYDKDGAILNGESNGVTLALYDGFSLVESRSINASKLPTDDLSDAYKSHRFSKLKSGVAYTIRFIANEYNKGFTAAGTVNGYVLKEFTFITEDSVTGELDLLGIDQIFGDSGLYDMDLAAQARARGDYVTGGYIETNGKFVENASLAAYKIPIEPGKTYAVMEGNSGQTVNNIFNKSGTYLGQIQTVGHAYAGFITVPDTATYTDAAYMWTRCNNLGNQGFMVIEYDSELTTDKPNLFEKDKITLHGKQVNGSGGIQVDARYSVSDYITVNSGFFYELRRPQVSVQATVVFYDRSKTLIQTKTVYQGLVQAPTNAVFMRFNITNSEADDTTVKEYMGANINAYNARMQVRIKDLKNDLLNNPRYSLKIYRAEIQDRDDDASYQQWGETIDRELEVIDGKVQPLEENVDYPRLAAGYAWKCELLIYPYGSPVVIDSVHFDTSARTYIVRNEDDLMRVNTDAAANYIVVEDFTLTKSVISGSNISIQGTIDFQGHRITSKWVGKGSNYMFYRIGKTGVIKNLILDYTYDYTGDAFQGANLGLSVSNEGKIENIVLNVDITSKTAPSICQATGLITSTNQLSGTIENFALHFKSPLNTNSYFGGVARYNYGAIKNGRVSGAGVKVVGYGFPDGTTQERPVITTQATEVSPVVSYNMGVMENIYSTADLYADDVIKVMNSGLLCGYVRNASQRSSYATGTYWVCDKDGAETADTSIQRMFGANAGGKLSGLWYVNPRGFSAASTSINKGDFSLLSDVVWQKSIIGQGGQFEIKNSIGQGIYPLVKLPASMNGSQTAEPLPTVQVDTQNIISTVVTEQHLDTADAIITVENPANYKIVDFEMEGLTATINRQGVEDGMYRVYVTVGNPTKFKSSYQIKSMTAANTQGSTVKTTYEATGPFGTKALSAEFYDKIETTADWHKIVNDPTSNYRLYGDMDFSAYTNYAAIRIGTLPLSGKLDGGKYDENEQLIGMYGLKNIYNDTNNSHVVYNLTGTIKNLIVENYSMTEKTTAASVGFIWKISESGEVDNVHIRNSKFFTKQTGGMLAAENRGSIVNSSVGDCIITALSGAKNISLGGLVGAGNYSQIVKSYVQEITVDGSRADSVNGVGGVIGFANVDTISEVWATGSVTVNGGYIGGIAGRVNATLISQCWTDVDIAGVGDNIGGISGTLSGTLSQTMVLGDILTRQSGTSFVNRISSDAAYTENNVNYAYENQLFNGEVTTEQYGATELISQTMLESYDFWEQMLDMGGGFELREGNADMTGEFTSADVGDGYLPLLVDQEGRLIYGQRWTEIDDGRCSIQVNQSTLNANTNAFTVNATIHHPGMEIEEFSMEGGEKIEYQKGETIDGETTFNISGTLNNSWDGYFLKCLLQDVAGKKATVRTKVNFADRVTKVITGREDWNTYFATRYNTYENVVISGNVDFSLLSTKPDVFNVYLNSMVGSPGTNPTISNLTIEAKANNTSFISVLQSEMKDITFQNITYDDKSFTGTDAGIIGLSKGEIKNINIENLDMTFNTGNHRGFIGMSENLNSGIEASNITMNAGKATQVGGVVGYLKGNLMSSTSNVTLKGTNHITGSGQHLGGVIGYIENRPKLISEISVINTEVNGGIYVGGIVGYVGQLDANRFYQLSVTNSIITGTSYVGGINGLSGSVVWADQLQVTDTVVTGTEDNVGGIGGGSTYVDRRTNGQITNSQVSNCTVSGRDRVGGMVGDYSSIKTSLVKNTAVSGTECVGGMAGIGQKMNDNLVENTTVTGSRYVGGMSGDTAADMGGNSVTGLTITGAAAEEDGSIGGLAGQSSGKLQNNTVKKTSISGLNNIGGLAGIYKGPLTEANGVHDDVTVTASGVNAGGLIGYALYYNTATTQRYSRVTKSYTAASVTGENYVGGLIGQFDPGADFSSWPKDIKGNYYGTPTTDFPGGDYFGLVFMGKVKAAASNPWVSAWGNRNSYKDIPGLGSTRIYEGADIQGKTVEAYYQFTIPAPLPPYDTTTAPMITKVTSSQLENRNLYLDSLTAGGMEWAEQQFDFMPLGALTGYNAEVYPDTGGTLVIRSKDTTLNGIHKVVIQPKSYVQDGLILWYDALNNQGLGVYDEDAVTWKNLASTGSVYDAALRWNRKEKQAATNAEQAKLVWSKGGLNWVESGKTGSYYGEISDIHSQLPNDLEYTIEVCYYQPKATTTGYGSWLCKQDSQNIVMAYGGGINSTLYYFSSSGSAIPNANNADTRTLTYVPRNPDPNTGIVTKRVYANGTILPSAPTSNGRFPEGTLLLGTGTWKNFNNQTISSVRIYNRVLTDAEIQANAALDNRIYVKSGSFDLAEKTFDVTFTDGVAEIQNAALELRGDFQVTILGATDAEVATGIGSVPMNGRGNVNLSLKEGSTLVVPGQEFKQSPTLTVENYTGDLQWYRSCLPNYGGVKIEGGTTSTATLYGRGYYYAVDSSGNYTPIVLVTTPGYMPYVKSNTAPYPTLEGQEDVRANATQPSAADGWYEGGTDIPDQEITIQRVTRMARMAFGFLGGGAPLPEAVIYPSGADTLNIEFDETIPYGEAEYTPNASFGIYIDGVAVAEQPISSRVYSFTYDFKTPIKISVSNGTEEKSYYINPEDVNRTVMTYGDAYYYISPKGISGSSGNISAEFVHMMKGAGLTRQGGIYDLATKKLTGRVSEFRILPNPEPIFKGTYGGEQVESYQGFAMVGGSLLEMGFVVDGGRGYSIPGDGTVIADGYVIDNYGGEEYFGLLGSDGVFNDVAGTINLPENFRVRKVDHTSNTGESDLPYLLLRYESGKVAGFNYMTGEELELIQPDDYEVGFLEFAGEFISDKFATMGNVFSGDYVFSKDAESLANNGALSDILSDGSVFTDGEGGDLVEDSVENTDQGSQDVVDGTGAIDGNSVEEGIGDGRGTAGSEKTEAGDENSDTAIDKDTEEKDSTGKQNTEKKDTDQKDTDQKGREKEAEASDKGDKKAAAGDKKAAGDQVKAGTTKAAEAKGLSQARQQRYIVAYNAATKRYELYEKEELLTLSTDAVSEAEKLDEIKDKLPELGKGTAAKGRSTNTKGVNIFVITIGSIMILMAILLLKKEKKNKKQ